MKNRLLEDIVDSQSDRSPPPLRPVRPAPPAQPPRPRAAVWRPRPPSSVPEPPPPPPAAEPARATTRAEPVIGSFSSRTPDWTVPLQPEAPPWMERWGRKALGWSLAVAASLVLGTTGVWMVRDNEVESTLAVVADHTPAGPVVGSAPLVTPDLAAAAPPPLKMLPPESVAALPEFAGSVDAPAAQIVDNPVDKPVEKPVVARPSKRRIAAAPAKPPAKRERTESRKNDARRFLAKRTEHRPAAAKKAGERAVARAPNAPPRWPMPTPEPLPWAQPAPATPAANSNLAETLRMCRAAGYHATACIKRGCEATRYGLACRG